MCYRYCFLVFYFLCILIACEDTSRIANKTNLIDNVSFAIDNELTLPEPVSFISTPETRVAFGGVSTEEVEKIADSNNLFGFKFYQTYIAQQETLNENIVFSPWAISIPLTMLYQGSRETTSEQIQTLMQYQQPKAITNQAINELDWWLRESANISQGGSYQLVNSLWIQAGFFPNETMTRFFRLLDNTEISVEMMFKSPHSLRHTRMENYHALELPFMGEQFSMLIILPDAKGYFEVETALSLEMINDIDAALELKSVTFEMPKFKITKEISLINLLSQLGISDTFNGQANFSGISLDLTRISQMDHLTKISVDENGVNVSTLTDGRASVIDSAL